MATTQDLDLNREGFIRLLLVWFKAHAPVLWAMIVPTLLVFFLNFFPLNLNWYWIWCYEGLRLYYIWPLWLTVAALCFYIVGQRFHSQHGRPMCFPVIAKIVAIGMVLMCIILACRWSLDWPALWVWTSIALLAVAAFVGTVGFIAFTEIWRKWYNGAVIDTILYGIAMDSRPNTNTSKFNPLLQWWPWRVNKRWGSPHRLAILSAYYELQQALVLMPSQGAPTYGDFQRFFRLGNILIEYLGHDWPKQGPTDPVVVGVPSSTDQWSVRVLLQMLAVGLRRVGQANAGDTKRSPTDDNLAVQLRNEIPRWREAMQKFLSKSQRAYSPLLEKLVKTGLDASQTDASGFRKIGPPIVKAFCLSPHTQADAKRVALELPEKCAQLWLVVAPASFSPEAIIDVWRKMRERQGLRLQLVSPEAPFDAVREPLDEDSPKPLVLDAVTVYAARRLFDLNERRRQGLPPTQQSGLTDTLVTLRERCDQLDELTVYVIDQHSELV
jgi:hypothetical protein